MTKIYAVEGGEATEITLDQALRIQNRDDYGHDIITAYCNTPEQALALAERYDANQITYDNISGEEAIRHGLVGLVDSSVI